MDNQNHVEKPGNTTQPASVAGGGSPIGNAAPPAPAVNGPQVPGAPPAPGAVSIPGVVRPHPHPAAAAAPAVPRQPFAATRADGLMALFCIPLGFFLVRWLFFTHGAQGLGVTVMSLLFAGATLVYALAKGVRPGRDSWFWLAVFLGCAVANGLWHATGMLAVARGLLWLGAGLYWCGCLFGLRLENKTGNLLALDAFNLLAIVPLANIDAPVLGLRALRGRKDGGKKRLRGLLPVLLGVAVSAILLAVVLPLLASADSQFFGGFLRDIQRAMDEFWESINLNDAIIAVMQLVLGLPLAWLLYGLLGGGAHKRYTRCLDVKSTRRGLAAARVVPGVTLVMVLAVACVVYAVFVGFQLPYFFSAFSGQMPEGFTQVSEYARAGFFELCRVAAINLGLLALAHTFGRRREGGKNRALTVLTLALCALTLLLCATAFSKMGLYIAMHGLTPKRVLTCVFIVFLAGVCLAAMVRCFKRFSVVRFGAVLGAALLCALCLTGLDGLVVRYNADAYLDGRLDTFDALIVYRSGPAGVPAALEVYNRLQDGDEKARLGYAIATAAQGAYAAEGSMGDSLDTLSARGGQVPRLGEEGMADSRRKFQEYYKDQWWRE